MKDGSEIKPNNLGDQFNGFGGYFNNEIVNLGNRSRL